MMKALAILGSPRKGSNSTILAREVLMAFDEAGVETEEIYLNALRINPCQACLGCRREGSKGCVYKDDMQPLYQKIRESDVLVFASPVYWWGPSAQLKAFLDRWYAFGQEKYRELAGKKVVLAISHSDSDPILAGAGLLTRSFQDICNHVNMKFVGVVHLSADAEKEVLNHPPVLSKARELGRLAMGK